MNEVLDAFSTEVYPLVYCGENQSGSLDAESEKLINSLNEELWVEYLKEDLEKKRDSLKTEENTKDPLLPIKKSILNEAETNGVDRIFEILQCNMWSSMVRDLFNSY
jgi:hypothetical protein